MAKRPYISPSTDLLESENYYNFLMTKDLYQVLHCRKTLQTFYISGQKTSRGPTYLEDLLELSKSFYKSFMPRRPFRYNPWP